jgi:hypothetical protein
VEPGQVRGCRQVACDVVGIVQAPLNQVEHLPYVHDAILVACGAIVPTVVAVLS